MVSASALEQQGDRKRGRRFVGEQKLQPPRRHLAGHLVGKRSHDAQARDRRSHGGARIVHRKSCRPPETARIVEPPPSMRPGLVLDTDDIVIPQIGQ